MMRPRFADAIGAAGYLITVIAVVALAFITRDAVLIGALIGITAAGNGFFLRARIEPPKP